jgi:hypothetical protein
VRTVESGDFSVSVGLSATDPDAERVSFAVE